jgi:hypothetical protein
MKPKIKTGSIGDMTLFRINDETILNLRTSVFNKLDSDENPLSNPSAIPINKATSFFIIGENSRSHEGERVLLGFSLDIVMNPDFRRGTVIKYESQKPKKFDVQTSKTNKKITLTELPLRF